MIARASRESESVVMRQRQSHSSGARGGRVGPIACLVAASVALSHDLARPADAADRFAEQTAPPLISFARMVTSGVYILGGLIPSAAYVVETPEGLVLIDAGLRSDASELKAQIAALGLDWKRIRAVLITHAHLDHSGGAEQVRVETGARVYAGQGDAGVLRAGEPAEAFFSAFSLPEGQLHKTHIDVELKGGETLTFGDSRIRVLATPGHTPGSTCYLLERGDLRVFFGGDVISMMLGDEKSHVKMSRPLGTYSAYLPPRYRGEAKAYLASLRMLRTLPVPDLVLPGHPRADPTPQYPIISRERWEEMLDKGIADMASLQARYEADGADFLDGTPKRLLADLFYLGDFRDGAVYGFFASSRFFLVDAPGGPGLLAFVQDSLRRLGLKPAAPAAVLLTSCDPIATAGLAELIERCHPQVVAPPGGFEKTRESCAVGTSILRAEELPGRGWFPHPPTTIPLRGRGVSPAAYRFLWGGKVVLFSGRMPIMSKPDRMAALTSELSVSREVALDYLVSLYGLTDPKPDLWLPAVPMDGQNANLYDTDWPDILADNYRLGYRCMMRKP